MSQFSEEVNFSHIESLDNDTNFMYLEINSPWKFILGELGQNEEFRCCDP